MKALLKAMLLYKHQLLYDTYYIYIYIYIYIHIHTGLDRALQKGAHFFAGVKKKRAPFIFS